MINLRRRNKSILLHLHFYTRRISPSLRTGFINKYDLKPFFFSQIYGTGPVVAIYIIYLIKSFYLRDTFSSMKANGSKLCSRTVFSLSASLSPCPSHYTTELVQSMQAVITFKSAPYSSTLKSLPGSLAPSLSSRAAHPKCPLPGGLPREMNPPGNQDTST